MSDNNLMFIILIGALLYGGSRFFKGFLEKLNAAQPRAQLGAAAWTSMYKTLQNDKRWKQDDFAEHFVVNGAEMFVTRYNKMWKSVVTKCRTEAFANGGPVKQLNDGRNKGIMLRSVVGKSLHDTQLSMRQRMDILANLFPTIYGAAQNEVSHSLLGSSIDVLTKAKFGVAKVLQMENSRSRSRRQKHTVLMNVFGPAVNVLIAADRYRLSDAALNDDNVVKLMTERVACDNAQQNYPLIDAKMKTYVDYSQTNGRFDPLQITASTVTDQFRNLKTNLASMAQKIAAEQKNEEEKQEEEIHVAANPVAHAHIYTENYHQQSDHDTQMLGSEPDSSIFALETTVATCSITIVCFCLCCLFGACIGAVLKIASSKKTAHREL